MVLICVQKNSDVAPYKKKGFVHYNHLATLMPTHVRGTHAFRPSQQSFGAIANQPFTPGSSSMAPPAVPKDVGDDFLDGSSSDEEPVPPPPSTPPTVST